jgi:flagella basal body P-ring formation protein FlgA
MMMNGTNNTIDSSDTGNGIGCHGYAESAELTRAGSVCGARTGKLADSRTRGTQKASTLRLLLGIAALLAILAAVSNAAADVIELRPTGESHGKDILLREVADLEGDAALALGETVVAQPGPAANEVPVTLAQVRRALDAASDVNWARLTLRGHAQCSVKRPTQAKPAPPAPVVQTPAPVSDVPVRTVGAVASNPVEPIDTSSALTVRAEVVATIEAMSGAGKDEISVRFSESDARTLDEAVGTDRILIEPTTRNTLGRIPLQVLRYRGEKLVSRDRLTAEVTRRMLVVVAARAINRGETIRQDDVDVREIVLDDPRVSPLTDPRDAWGKAATTSIRKDDMVCEQHVKPPVVIERNAYVTVRCISGSVVLRMECTAMESGSVGQMIEVRNPLTREIARVRVTGPGQAVLFLGGEDQAGEAVNQTIRLLSAERTGR